VFSNLLSSISSFNQSKNHLTPSSSLSKNPILPYMDCSQPHANQTNILPSSQNFLTLQISALWAHNPTSATPLAQDTPCPISTTIASLDTPIENTLNALSLFQKPIQLFSSNHSPSSSLSNPNSPLISNQVDPSLHKPIQSDQNKLIPTESLNITATNYKNTSLFPPKSITPTNKPKNPPTTLDIQKSLSYPLKTSLYPLIPPPSLTHSSGFEEEIKYL
jgi:hypothetical protein